MQRYPWLYSEKAKWLEQRGRVDQARAGWTQAAPLTDNEADRAFLLRCPQADTDRRAGSPAD